MAETYQLVKSTLDTSGPIDFDELRESVETLGPLRMSQRNNPYIIELSVHPCECGSAGCTSEVVTVVRRNGLFWVRWQLSPEELLEFESLDEFRLYVLAGFVENTSQERQIIEHHVEKHLGCHFSETDKIRADVCVCGNCAESIGENEIARRMLLTQLAMKLQTRQTILESALEEHGEEGEDLASYAFDVGYQMGRIFSEYQVKEDIEEHAIAGMNFEELKAERARRAGVKSSGKRAERIASLLAHMERLAGGSAALLRVGPQALSKMAFEDASAENPLLWSQGGGQVDEYVGIIRRGEAGKDMQARYAALFPTISTSCLKTA